MPKLDNSKQQQQHAYHTVCVMSIKAYNEEMTNKEGSVAVTQLQNKKYG